MWITVAQFLLRARARLASLAQVQLRPSKDTTLYRVLSLRMGVQLRIVENLLTSFGHKPFV